MLGSEGGLMLENEGGLMSGKRAHVRDAKDMNPILVSPRHEPSSRLSKT